MRPWTLLKTGQKLTTMPKAAVMRSFVMNTKARLGSLSKGLWRSMKNGSTATALVPDPLTDLSGATNLRNGRVHVAPLPTA